MKRKAKQAEPGAFVDPLRLWWLVLGYVRYALHRMSTAPSQAGDFIASYCPAMRPEHVEQIAEEIETEILYAELNGKTVGMACDHVTWKRNAAIARKILDGMT